MTSHRAGRRDFNQAAQRTVQSIIDRTEASPKNPAAVALGKLGGRKGGKARAERLTAERRAEIPRAAARARWDQTAANTQASGGIGKPR